MKQITAILAVLAVTVAVSVGCAGSARSGATPVTAGNLGPDPSDLLDQAKMAKQSGRYEQAAEAFEALAQQSPPPQPRLVVRAYAEAAVCWLAAGNEERFIEATDALWEGAGEYGRRDLGADEIALVGLADRLRDKEPRVPVRVLPPEVRTVLESPPVATWQLMNSGPEE